MSIPRTLERLLPILGWLPRYPRTALRGDLLAGITTAVMLIPQGMAYAMLAGLPPVIGLYASLVPLVAYALFGTSRELAVGPVAMDSLLVAAGVGAIAAQGTAEYVTYAILLALMAGVMQVVMGALRLGFLVNFLSQPVISGFTSAAALIIGLSQLKHLLGVDLASSNILPALLADAAAKIGGAHLPTVAIGAGSIVALVALKRLSPRLPRALIVVALTTVLVWLTGLDRVGVGIVGAIEGGLPTPALPEVPLDVVLTLAPTALAIALVAFMEAVSVARAIADRKRYPIEPSQELIALGAANVAAAFFRGYPVTGGFSRTAVNDQAGATSQVAALVTAGVVALALLFLTPLLHYLPRATLAAIIMTAVFGLIDVAQVRRLWRVKRSDLALLTLTFVAVLVIGIQLGILIGVAASLLWFIVRTTRPHFAVLGQLPGTPSYRNLRYAPEAITFPGLLIVRIDAAFYFGNVTFLRSTLSALEAAQPEPLRALILDAAAVNDLDSSADAALHEIAADLRGRGVRLLFAGVKGPVRQVMARSGLIDRVGVDNFFLSVDDAVHSARAGEAAGIAAPPCDPLVRRCRDAHARPADAAAPAAGAEPRAVPAAPGA